MSRSRHPLSYLTLALCLAYTASAAAGSNVPGILNFAKDYQATDHHAQKEREKTKQTALANELNAQKKAQDNTRQSLKEQQTALALIKSQYQQAKELAVKQAQQIAQLKEQAALLEKPASLSQGLQERSYAAGLNIGREALDMQAQRKLQGLDTDLHLMLVGIIDAFNAKPMLDENKVKTILEQSEKDLAASKEKIITAQIKQGELYNKKMTRDKGYKTSGEGFLYKIDYAGDAAIGDNDIVDIAVVEKLTDGTVIHDMGKSGDVVSQTLNNYPPLFNSAIKLLKNHGSIAVIAPPSLAYGDEGYAPNIPPAATVIYEIRIVDVKAVDAKK